jgi:RimJ/RimL family protein N-acetyltransferase
MKLSWRSAALGDAQDLYDWRNSVSGRRYSGNSSLITYSHHTNWLSSRLERSEPEPFLIFSHEKIRVGMARFELSTEINNSFEVSILVDPKFQGMGYGTKILQISCDEVNRKFPIKSISARVKVDNLVSIYLFENVGFVERYRTAEFIFFERITKVL